MSNRYVCNLSKLIYVTACLYICELLPARSLVRLFCTCSTHVITIILGYRETKKEKARYVQYERHLNTIA